MLEKETAVIIVVALAIAVAIVTLGGCAALQTEGAVISEVMDSAEPSMIAEAVKAVAPGISPLWGLLIPLLFKRSRKHLTDAAGKVIPHDGKVDMAGTLASILKAFGLKNTK